VWLKQEPQDMHSRIKEITAQEQKAVLKDAKEMQALVIAEDTGNYAPSGGCAPLRKFLYGLIAHQYATTFLANLTGECKKQDIACINAEVRYDAALADGLVKNLLIIPAGICDLYMMDFLINKFITSTNSYELLKEHWKVSVGLGLAPFILCLDPLYAAYKNYKACKATIKDDAQLTEFANYCKAYYKGRMSVLEYLDFGVRAAWQVDVTIVKEVLAHQTAKTIMICAGFHHTENVGKFLQDQGYTKQAISEDLYAKITGFQRVDIEHPIDIAKFIAETHLQRAAA
jgi:hypothetical protein